MSATRLGLYNEALAICGERKLASLSENREPRRVLDDVWTRGRGATSYCLELGQWNFATRAQQIQYTASVAPAFGFRRAFAKPVDLVRLTAICADEYFRAPLTDRDYADEAGYWYADLDITYVRFVSDDAAYGNDLSRWPETFTRFVATYLADEIVEKLTQSATKRQMVHALWKERRTSARTKDAQGEGARFPPAGTWSRARASGSGRRDAGSRSSLIG
jgi:hypothetical protein